MQRYPTFSVHGQQHHRLFSAGGSLASKCVDPACCSEVGSRHRDQHYTYQTSNASHQSATVSGIDDGPQLCDGVAVTPSVVSDDNAEMSSDDSHWFQFDRSRSISNSYSHMTTSRLHSAEGHGIINHSMSSNFYSTSTHYSMEPSRITADCPSHVPSGLSTVSSYSVSSTVQQKQNIIQVSKPFESSDVLRYSEKLRRQRLNNCVAALSEFL